MQPNILKKLSISIFMLVRNVWTAVSVLTERNACAYVWTARKFASFALALWPVILALPRKYARSVPRYVNYVRKNVESMTKSAARNAPRCAENVQICAAGLTSQRKRTDLDF
jgi:type IV secretory pathway TrbD component